MQKKLRQYDMIRAEIQQNYVAVRFAKEANPAEIPLPDGAAVPGAALTPTAPSHLPPCTSGEKLRPPGTEPTPAHSLPSHMILPEYRTEPGHGILKKKQTTSQHPPGPPVGPAPPLSDSEDESEDEEDEEREEGTSGEKRSRVRFEGVDDGEAEKDSRTKFKQLAKKMQQQEAAQQEEMRQQNMPVMPILRHPVPGAQPLFPQGARMMRPPPPPPGLPPARILQQLRGMGVIGGQRMGQPGGIGPQINPVVPPPNTAVVIQAEPTVNINAKKSGPVIEGKPQMRNMHKELTRLVPTALKVKRTDDKKKPKPNTFGSMTGGGQSDQSGSQGGSKDSAYDEFMKEISGLI